MHLGPGRTVVVVFTLHQRLDAGEGIEICPLHVREMQLIVRFGIGDDLAGRREELGILHAHEHYYAVVDDAEIFVGSALADEAVVPVLLEGADAARLYPQLIDKLLVAKEQPCRTVILCFCFKDGDAALYYPVVASAELDIVHDVPLSV